MNKTRLNTPKPSPCFFLGAPASAVSRYASAAAALGALPRLLALHHDEGSGQFLDYGLHTEDVTLAWQEVPTDTPGSAPQVCSHTTASTGRYSCWVQGNCSCCCAQGNCSCCCCRQHCHTAAAAAAAAAAVSTPGVHVTITMQRQLLRSVGSQPTHKLVPAFGYVSLFPLAMQLLPHDAPQLGVQLQLLRDPSLLWTPYGLRSLAPSSSLYKKCVVGDATQRLLQQWDMCTGHHQSSCF
jgi:Glycosyl hydrolase family 63 C-terminal domain